MKSNLRVMVPIGAGKTTSAGTVAKFILPRNRLHESGNFFDESEV
jgi:hypothetical protein